MRANQLQLQHLTNHLGNLGHEVGRAIASHPTRHSHTIQATLSQPNVAPGQSNDSRVLGLLTRTTPPSMSIPSFNYGPYVQAFQPQPNDKHTRRIDKVTHQIVQRYLPTSVKTRYDAAHSTGTALPVSDFINGFKFVVESSMGHGHEVFRAYYWHPSFGTGCITASGFMLQPNIQEQEFRCHAPSLDSLDPTSVRLFHLDLCQVAHDYSIHLPAYEEYQPEVTFSTIECGDAPTARVTKFCKSKVPQWAALVHHHLKRDKIIPSTHPQANEIKHNPNGYEALMLSMCPYHPQFTDNGILIRPHPQQGPHSLDKHFRRCEFYYYEQCCYLGTDHNWQDDIHRICFLDLCQNADILCTLYNQEKHVPTCQYKFKRERIVATLKEYIASPAFVLMGGRPSVASATQGSRTTAPLATTRPASTGNGTGATRYRFSRSNGNGSGGNAGTQRSGTTGHSPRDRNVRAIEASPDSSLLDDDLSTEHSDDLIAAKLNGDCLGGCNTVHPPYECPNLVRDVEHQKKTFTSLSGRRRYLPVRAITTADRDDDDVNLIDLHDPDDEDSDADLDFPWGRLHVLLVVLALVVIGVMVLSAETRIRPPRDCVPHYQLVQTKFLWHQ